MFSALKTCSTNFIRRIHSRKLIFGGLRYRSWGAKEGEVPRDPNDPGILQYFRFWRAWENRSQHTADGVPRTYTLIFRSKLRRYAVVGYALTVGSFPVTAYNSWQGLTDDDFLKKHAKRTDLLFAGAASTSVKEFRYFLMLAAAVHTCVLFAVTRSYSSVLYRIYLNEANGVYTCVKRDYFFRRSQIKCMNKDVALYEHKNRWDMLFGNVTIKGKRFMVTYEGFFRTGDYNKFVNFNTFVKPDVEGKKEAIVRKRRARRSRSKEIAK